MNPKNDRKMNRMPKFTRAESEIFGTYSHTSMLRTAGDDLFQSLNCNTINSYTINNLSSYSNFNIGNLITTSNSIFTNSSTMLNINSLHVSGP